MPRTSGQRPATRILPPVNVLLLHPGEMGASVGAALVSNRHEVAWVSTGRSEATRRRALRAGLRATENFTEGAERAEVLISVCPPEAAEEVARRVDQAGFRGLYADANAVAPATAARIERRFGARYVDGGIVGPPAWQEGSTRLYLSGERAGEVAALFRGSLLDARVIDGGGDSGAASALKMCYAAFTKGSSALLLGVRALAERSGVAADLLAEWELSQPGLAARSEAAARSTSPKAWRFEGEMRQIAAAFDNAGLPAGFHDAAADLYARMADLKDTGAAGGADIDTVLKAILRR